MKSININRVNSLFEATEYFEKIVNVATNDTLEVNFSNASFIRNHYLSIIGMGLKVVLNRGMKVSIIAPSHSVVLASMKRIGFLSQFTNEKDNADTHKTMIKYTNIPLENYDLPMQQFYVYFIGQFTGKVENLSKKLLNKILQKILELFSNVFRHSESALGLFCSGQFYPQSKRFNFTIADNGKTIKTNVNRYLLNQFLQNRSVSDKVRGKKFQPLSGVESIQWALEDTNSSTGEGGLGLSLLMDLIKVSGGSIEIISNDGYYSIKNGLESYRTIERLFEGTVISIELNTDSERYYYLKEEQTDGNS